MAIKLKEQIKILLLERDMKMKDLAAALEIKLGKPFSPTNLSARLKRESLTYAEITAICSILNYELEFKSLV